MKVALICKSLNTELGGIQTHTRYLAMSLAKQGAEVHILTAGSWKGRSHWQLKGVKIHPLRYFPGYRLNGLRRLADDLAFNLYANRWLKAHQHEFDLLHVQGRSGVLFAAKGRLKVPVILTFHGLTREEYWHTHHKSGFNLDGWLHQLLFHRWETTAFHRATGVITVSEFMKEQLEENLGSPSLPVKVISNGVRVEPLEPKINRTRHLTFLGRIEENKGIRWLPDILASLPSHIHLQIIGTGKLTSALRNAFLEKKLLHRVDWVGPLPNPMVMPLLEKSLALLIPSIYEPQGLVALEAFERGVPVIASRIGGLKELVLHKENGWLVEPGDVNKIVEYVNRLDQDPTTSRRMGQMGRDMVQNHYQWHHIASQTLAFYNETLQQVVPHEVIPQRQE